MTVHGSLAEFAKARVLVLGDCMLDEYLHGVVARVSPEAPVPVVTLASQSCGLGGSGNVAANIAALGGKVALAGVVGADAEGHEIRALLQGAGIDDTCLVEALGVRTVRKTRVVAGKFHQLLRLDRDGDSGATAAAAIAAAERIVAALAEFDVVVLADYDKGSLPAALAARVLKACRSHGIPAIVDPKKADFSAYRGATVLTPNRLELERATGLKAGSEQDLAQTAETFRQQLDVEHLLVTLSAEGMLLVNDAGRLHVSAEVREVADVTGAGDTVVAAFALAFARGWPADQACRLASLAAGIAVARPRTYVVQSGELEKAWLGHSIKVVDRETAVARVAAARAQGQSIVFTNGCFDVLHAGHLACLEGARKLGDLLVLGLNSDASVRALKGPGRPAIGQAHRAALLAGLACVDLVVIFDEPTPEPLLELIAPDVLAKGGDYDPTTIVGGDIVRSRGGRVVAIPYVEGLSSTRILDRAALRF